MTSLFLEELDQWKRISCKQSARCQHPSQLKASVFLSLQRNIELLRNATTYTCDWYCHL